MHLKPASEDDALSSVRLSTFGLRREPPRPPDDRKGGYEALFDYDTLYYDVFRSGDGRRVICQGPPLLGCQALSDLTFRLPDTERPLVAYYLPPRTIYQPTHRVHLFGEGLSEARTIVLQLADTRIEVPIQPSGRARFAGRRVVTTLSKNNPLDWIRDWAEFNIRVHGADAIILYDNGSTDYTLADIGEHLGTLDGLADLLVVPWIFPYGPGVGPRNVQDSFFCQPGQLDHVRRRYCEEARAVLNTDIDELVVVPRGESIFERIEQSRRATFVFSGTWAEAVGRGEDFGRMIRHTDCRYRWWSQVLRECRGRIAALLRYRAARGRRRLMPHEDPYRGRLLRSKWIAVPGRCGDGVEWGVHDVYPVSNEAASDQSSWKEWPADIVYRHFRQLTTNARRRERIEVQRYSPLHYVRDRPLAAAFAVAFPERNRRGVRSVMEGLRALVGLRKGATE